MLKTATDGRRWRGVELPCSKRCASLNVAVAVVVAAVVVVVVVVIIAPCAPFFFWGFAAGGGGNVSCGVPRHLQDANPQPRDHAGRQGQAPKSAGGLYRYRGESPGKPGEPFRAPCDPCYTVEVFASFFSEARNH